MAWQRQRSSYIPGCKQSCSDIGWCDIPEWRVKERFRDNVHDYLQIMHEMMSSGEMRVIGKFMYRFVKT